MKKKLIVILFLIMAFVIISIIVRITPKRDYVKQSKLYISEVMPKNTKTIQDDDLEYSDYIESFSDSSTSKEEKPEKASLPILVKDAGNDNCLIFVQ